MAMRTAAEASGVAIAPSRTVAATIFSGSFSNRSIALSAKT
ncbi:MAG TPA: hypothetical protein VM451_09355 [Candidatus Limnocylindria bacterium]|nr:hypothetical protein [Candidatus Limnocylindria bacterium]